MPPRFHTSLSVLATTLALPAFAYVGGINGFSGKQGSSCSACHAASGSAPAVTLTGPTTLTVGQTGDYVVTVSGGPGVRAGMNAAAGPGTIQLNPDNTSTRMLAFEITHNNPQAFVSGTARFTFQMVAPTTPGTVTLYAAGLSSNNSGTNAGDNSATRTLTVNVVSGNQAPTVSAAAAASPATVSGTTAALSVLGADDNGESALSYTWVSSAGPAPVTFSANMSNAAKNTTATFTRAGTYTLAATVKDAQGLTASSSVDVTVSATLTSITVSPSTAGVAPGSTQAFTGAAVDQFGQAKSATFTWSASGGGTVSTAGVFTAGATAGGPFTVTAASGGKTGTAMVTVTGGTAPTIATAASAASATIGTSSVGVSVLGADNGGEPALVYTWEGVGATFAPNGTNAAKNSTATFGAPGTYPLTVTVKDATGLTATSTTTVTVNATLTALTVSPMTGTVASGGTLQFSSSAVDQFGVQLSPAPSITWSVAGGGTISSTGLFRAGTVQGGPFTVSANAGTLLATAAVMVGAGAAPTLAQPPTAYPAMVAGRSTSLHVMGTAPNGEAELTYSWTSAGPAPVSFSLNGTNAAKSTVASFGAAGTYELTVALSDAQGGMTSSMILVTVQQSLTEVTVTPSTAEVRPSASLQFRADAVDQFGASMSSPLTAGWAVGGGGAIDANGLFTALGTGGSSTVSATVGGVRGLAVVTVSRDAPLPTGDEPQHGQNYQGEWNGGCSSAPSLLGLLALCLLLRRRTLP